MPLAIPITLTDLTASSDRLQRQFDAMLTDMEAMPASSVEYRLGLLERASSILARMVSVRKTLVALRDRPRDNFAEMRRIGAVIDIINKELDALDGTLGRRRRPPLSASADALLATRLAAPSPPAPPDPAPAVSAPAMLAPAPPRAPRPIPPAPTHWEQISEPRFPRFVDPTAHTAQKMRDELLYGTATPTLADRVALEETLAQTTPETLRAAAEQYLPEDQDAFYRDSETGLRIKQALYVAYGHRETLSALAATAAALAAALPTAETTTAAATTETQPPAAAAGADPSADTSPDASAETSVAAAAPRASAASMPRRTASAAQTLPILPHLDSDDFTDRFTTTVAAISTQITTTHQAILADQPQPESTPPPPNATTHPTPQHSPVSPGSGCPSDFVTSPWGLLSPHGP